MKEVLLLIIGFSFAFYIFKYRYSAANHISEFLLYLERIDFDRLFNRDPKMEIRKSLESLDLRAPNFYIDLSVIFNEPFKRGIEYYEHQKKILGFLDADYFRYFPHNEYFKVNTDLISELISKSDKLEGKLDFIREFIVCNYRVSQMAEGLSSDGYWALDEKQEDEFRRRFETIFYNWKGPFSVMDETEENQLNQLVLFFISEGKKGLISLIDYIKPKYIEKCFRSAIKRASLVLIILVSLQAIFYFVWHIDLLERTAELLWILLTSLAR